MIDSETRDLFWSKVDKRAPDECWEWSASRTPAGYGIFNSKCFQTKAAHRIALILCGTTFQPGEVCDHMCRNRACCNPSHLRAVSQRINSIENSIGPTAINHAKNACHKGHQFTKQNTIMKRGKRHCRECQRQHNKEYMDRNSAHWNEHKRQKRAMESGKALQPEKTKP